VAAIAGCGIVRLMLHVLEFVNVYVPATQILHTSRSLPRYFAV